jgi:3-methyl-2-oxobutanoate hydroxymethyltransferase
MKDLPFERITVPVIRNLKIQGKKITALTAYDYAFARLVDQAGMDLILVGDSLGCVMQGLDTTLPVTLEEMIYHCRCVTRGVQRALVVGDMPFLSYQVSPEQAVMSAGRMLKEGGVAAVKLEGGVVMAPTIERLTSIDIPVMAHIGLTPQSVHRMGGYKVQGRAGGEGKGSAAQLIADARAVEAAGSFAVVLEGVPAELAAEITRQLSIPTVGIGAGVNCDGQILVLHDLLGLIERKPPRFVKQYADLHDTVIAAVQRYMHEVLAGAFPSSEYAYHLGSAAGTAETIKGIYGDARNAKNVA